MLTNINEYRKKKLRSEYYRSMKKFLENKPISNPMAEAFDELNNLGFNKLKVTSRSDGC